MNKTKDFLSKFRPIILLILFSVIITTLRPNFISPNNLLNVLRQTSINAIIAAGMTFVILTGGIDLSVGSILAFSSAIGAYILVSGYGVVAAVLVCLFIGILAGGLNGVIITKGKAQPFIATLATMTLLKGATLVFTQGKPISVLKVENLNGFRMIGAGSIFGIPTPVYIMGIVFIVCYFILNNTKTGRYIYAIGGNEEASKLSGLNTDIVKIKSYIINGLFAAMAGLILTSRLVSAQPNAGDGYELDAIAAVVLGGTSLAGGQGSILGTIFGALIIGILNNSLNLMNVSSYYQMVVRAIVILLAVLLDRKNK
ncbi:ribose ABC transporter permease [Peptoniphilus indolicus]|uniref:Ribose ABC superfamily ATP binding cassette transporter, permease protein n=2 Tax=Peptoniphilus indolicus TaxID=33030 RepID=G4D6T6_9FIRM|nr:ribose ABC transporter permease [Peptoniphilus indolicus]EGY76387.1 ribose ABC superfamily ATP binding cassette transporter, permease protein [Peptoniphilus indolicus ATCC 29427]SUB76083.1 Ribose transport system permease protein rbsC [Peptoniphilus indolicus]